MMCWGIDGFTFEQLFYRLDSLRETVKISRENLQVRVKLDSQLRMIGR